MNVSARPIGTPFKAFLLLCCLAAVLATQAEASEVYIPATTSGCAEEIVDNGGRTFGKYYGDLWYGVVNWTHAVSADLSFLKFSLDTLPDTWAILSAELGYYQYASQYRLPTVSIRLIRDPVPLSAEDLFWEIDGAGALTPVDTSTDGWVTWPFDTTVRYLLDSCRETGWISLGVGIPHTSEDRLGKAYGNGGAEPPYLRVVYLTPDETDIQAVRAELATYPLSAQKYDTARLTLTNRGGRTSGTFWAYASSAGVPTESAFVGPIAGHETTSVRIALPPQENNGDTLVDYCLYVVEEHDSLHLDDTTRLQCWVFPPATYAAQGFDEPEFPPPGWVIVDNDSGNQCWQWRADSGMSHFGVGFTMCVHEQTRPNDDWLIGGPVCPKPDDRDSVGFFARDYQIRPPMDLEVWTMNGQQVADTSVRLLSLRLQDTLYSRRSVSLDTSDGDTVYIGFRYRYQGDWNGLCLDDIWFSSTFVPGTCEPQGTVARQPELAFSPNPTTGMYVTVRYSIAAGTRGKLTLRDALGRTVKSFTLDPSGSMRLDLRGFAPGVYVATLDAAGQSVSRKLIITAR
jgi:hypothetical protein